MAVHLLDGKQPVSGDLAGRKWKSAIGETVSGEKMIVETIPSDTMAAVAFAATRRCAPETILLVEDEAFVRKVTAEVLESAGYRLVIAGSATEALKACGGCFRPLDLVFADVVMPGMNGRELAVELT